ncbi:MAG: hypothetical protein WC515_03695 [Candidatus Omnitrophota bacterium]
MSKRPVSDNKGFAIIYTFMFVFLLVLIITAFSSIAYSSLSMANRTCNTMRAYYIAEAGLARKFMDLRSGSTSSLSGTFTIAAGNTGSYSVTVTQVSGGLFPTYRLDSTGTYRNVSERVSLTLKQISCARYAYLSNSEDLMFWWGSQPIWFVTGDRLTGPVYSNDQLNISGSPVFEGAVSSAASSINYYHGGPPTDDPDFQDSLTLGAPVIQLPSFVNDVKAAAQQPNGVYLTGNTIMTLLPDGTMNVTNAAQGWISQNMPLPPNGALFVSGGYVDISGTLSGQLTVGTDNNIYVVNNLRYNDDPRINPDSSDALGLVSQNNVLVDINAPFNMEIDAYIVALNSSFSVQGYDSVLKGTLTLYGGMTQQRRGGVGTFNASTNQKVSGYTKNYMYDDRFANVAPLYFPPAVDSNGRIVYLKIVWSEL